MQFSCVKRAVRLVQCESVFLKIGKMERELSNNIRSSLVRKGVVYRSLSLFTKVQKGHRVIKMYEYFFENCQNFHTTGPENFFFAVFFAKVIVFQRHTKRAGD